MPSLFRTFETKLKIVKNRDFSSQIKIKVVKNRRSELQSIKSLNIATFSFKDRFERRPTGHLWKIQT